MKSLTLKNVPDELYSQLQAWAKKNHRSLQEQVKLLLEKEVRLVKGGQLVIARKWRQILTDRNWGNIVDDIRKERNR
jgi:hypothetical protein